MRVLLCLVAEKLYWVNKNFKSVMISLSSCVKLLLLPSGFVKFQLLSYMYVWRYLSNCQLYLCGFYLKD
jgi:hypothetical protein